MATNSLQRKHIQIHIISSVSGRQILLQGNSISAKHIKSSEGISMHQVQKISHSGWDFRNNYSRIATRIFIIRYMQHPIYIADPEGVFVTSTRTIEGVKNAA